jgi:hypothetical protein
MDPGHVVSRLAPKNVADIADGIGWTCRDIRLDFQDGRIASLDARDERGERGSSRSERL